MQPKRYENPKIALLNVELELKAEKDNAEVRVKSVEVWSPQRAKLLTDNSISSHYISLTFPLSAGLSGHRWCRVEHPVWQTGEDLQVWSQGGSVKVANWWCGHPVLRWQRPVLCWQSSGRGSKENHDGRTRRQTALFKPEIFTEISAIVCLTDTSSVCISILAY